ncbi:hypothetical protein LXL04_002955 [Taraxacum kok-saghyz]
MSEILEIPKMSYRKMKAYIPMKFNITVSIGQCRNARKTIYTKILPPISRILPRRPKTKRRNGQFETKDDNKQKITRAGITQRCGYCQGHGHKKKKCTRKGGAEGASRGGADGGNVGGAQGANKGGRDGGNGSGAGDGDSGNGAAGDGGNSAAGDGGNGAAEVVEMKHLLGLE